MTSLPIKMATCVLLAVIFLTTSVFSSDVPVLIWSPDRPLSDLPQAPALDSIPQDTFHSNYLSRLLDKENRVIVAFLQDKLHINDISKYADVYNPNSDGGAFKNIKGLLDEHFSLELPHVLDSSKAVNSLKSKFEGLVHEITSPSNLADLNLGEQKNYLLIVRLKPVTTAKNEEAAIAANDKLVGQVAEHLQKRSVPYTALYTAESSENAQQGSRQGRRLLQDVPDVDNNGAFLNVSYGNGSLYMYITHVSMCLYANYDPDKPQCTISFTDSNLKDKVNGSADWGANNTLEFTLLLTNLTSNKTTRAQFDISATMKLIPKFDRWMMSPLTVVMNSTDANYTVLQKEQVLSPRQYEYDTTYSMLYSFHCSEMNFYQNLTNVTVAYGRFTLGGFQIQPFNATGSGFALSQDCVGWFTTAIWMALIPVAINIAILFFGMYMIASLSTNDRFDDPKGKTLNINAGE